MTDELDLYMQLCRTLQSTLRRAYHTEHSTHPHSSTRISLTASQMARAMSVTFLGTSSGGGPSNTRNCSSLVTDLLGNNKLWMVDCAEGTVRQFQNLPWKENVPRINKVSKVFITHMHADHIMGITTMLRNVLYPPPIIPDPIPVSQKPLRVEIYGPAGIRHFVRANLKMTLSKCSDRYVVHELLTETDTKTACSPEELHYNEAVGQDIVCDQDGFWRAFTKDRGFFGDIIADAGPIQHRDPCLGYVFREGTSPNRKLVILGDTHNPTAMKALCINPSPELLVHEATDCCIPSHVDYKNKRTVEQVREKALARGHSIPSMAGDFAREIGAKKLVLNHISSRFPAPDPGDTRSFRARVIQEIETQASEAWGGGRARAAWDFMTITIPAPEDFSREATLARMAEDDLDMEEPVAVTSSSVPNLYRGRGRGGGYRGINHGRGDGQKRGFSDFRGQKRSREQGGT